VHPARPQAPQEHGPRACELRLRHTAKEGPWLGTAACAGGSGRGATPERASLHAERGAPGRAGGRRPSPWGVARGRREGEWSAEMSRALRCLRLARQTASAALGIWGQRFLVRHPLLQLGKGRAGAWLPAAILRCCAPLVIPCCPGRAPCSWPSPLKQPEVGPGCAAEAPSAGVPEGPRPAPWLLRLLPAPGLAHGALRQASAAAGAAAAAAAGGSGAVGFKVGGAALGHLQVLPRVEGALLLPAVEGARGWGPWPCACPLGGHCWCPGTRAPCPSGTLVPFKCMCVGGKGARGSRGHRQPWKDLGRPQACRCAALVSLRLVLLLLLLLLLLVVWVHHGWGPVPAPLVCQQLAAGDPEAPPT